MCEIIGKYKVVDTRAKKQLGTIVTDNHLEAILEANKSQFRTIVNVCGDKNFYKDEKGWHVVR